MHRPRRPIAPLALLSLAFTLLARPIAADEWAYLDNGQIKLGVLKSSGGAIGYLSASGSDHNLVNHFDRGRLVQQSYYGNKDDSLWDKKPWRWNPVQGGDWRGSPSKLLDLKVEPPAKLYAKTQPKHWASGADVPDVTMEEWITLNGRVAHVRYRMTYRGNVRHVEANQETPAVFVDAALDTLVLYDGAEPWKGRPASRSKPGWPNESRKMTENWAAYIDKDDFGVGAYVPAADRLTCYRYGKGGAGACSYFAPLVKFAIVPGFAYEYDLYLTVGTSDRMRETFKSIHDGR